MNSAATDTIKEEKEEEEVLFFRFLLPIFDECVSVVGDIFAVTGRAAGTLVLFLLIYRQQ